MVKRFRHIPAPIGKNDGDSLRAVVDATQYITAQTSDKIKPLPSTATTADLIAKVNELISRLQGD